MERISSGTLAPSIAVKSILRFIVHTGMTPGNDGRAQYPNPFDFQPSFREQSPMILS
jgi:hypothetical protein